MINVSNTFKQKFINEQGVRDIVIRFSTASLNFYSKDIVAGSFQLEESICSDSVIQFKGCVVSKLTFTIGKHNGVDLTDRPVSAELWVDNEYITLFNGYVDSVEKSESNSQQKYVCYDSLFYKYSDLNVASWYNSFTFPTTIGQFRRAFYSQISLNAQSIDLPNDDIIIQKVFDPEEMSALEVLRQICSANGVFGILNRDNVFEHRFPDFKTKNSSQLTNIEVVKSFKRESEIYPILGVEVRDNEQDSDFGIYPSTPGDKNALYIINGNMFVDSLDKAQRTTMSQNIYSKIGSSVYVPFTLECKSYPWLEVGDRICVKALDYSSGDPVETITYTTILERTFNDAPYFMDTYKAQGESSAEIIICDNSSFTNSTKNSKKQEVRAMSYYIYKNNTSLKANENVLTEIIKCNFAIVQKTHLCINMQMIMKIDTSETVTDTSITVNDADIQYFYYLDGELIEIEEPEEIYVDGYHITTLRHDISPIQSGLYTFQVFVKCKGATIDYKKNNIQAILNADGLAEENAWNGKIDASDKIVGGIGFDIVKDITDSVVIKNVNTTKNTASESIALISFDSILGGIVDTFVVNPNMITLSAYVNADMFTTDATLTDGVYKNGTIVTNDFYHITGIQGHAYNCTFLVSLDSGTTWKGYDEGRWVVDDTMTYEELKAIPSSAWGTKARIKISIRDNATFNEINLMGGTVNA